MEQVSTAGIYCTLSITLTEFSRFRIRRFCHAVVHHRFFDPFIMGVIFISSLTLAIEDPLRDDNPRNAVSLISHDCIVSCKVFQKNKQAATSLCPSLCLSFFRFVEMWPSCNSLGSKYYFYTQQRRCQMQYHQSLLNCLFFHGMHV